jgi:hypothetical protein
MVRKRVKGKRRPEMKDDRPLLSPLQGFIMLPINYRSSQLRPHVSHNRRMSLAVSSIANSYGATLTLSAIQTRLRDRRR